MLVSNIPGLEFVYNLYCNTNIKTKASFQNDQSYMCIYSLQEPKHKHKVSLPKLPVLHVYIPSRTTKHKHKVYFPKYPFLHV